MNNREPAAEIVSPVAPMGNFVIVKEVADVSAGRTDSGLYVTSGNRDNAPGRAAFGKVVAIGPGSNSEEPGVSSAMNADSKGVGVYSTPSGSRAGLAVADIVAFPAYAGFEIIIGGKSFKAVRENELIGVVTDDV